ncbi:hypothetical protein Daus18300_004513 [Diaporthe australafricana]|uniref:Cytochrome P450 n=1 Tax=Diaporthe australafricana TaxID=127596 RepID=A0ABR3X7S9_9PEZI
MEVFRKTDFQNRGANLGGIVWEEDPVRHREAARKLAPAFSARTIRAMEPVIHKHYDHFVARMKELGAAAEDVNLVDWTHWVAWDTSTDLAWNEEMFAMRDKHNSVYLDVLLGFNAFATVIQVFKRFPLISPIKYLFAPVAKLSSLAAMERNTRTSVEKRISRQGNTPHMDLFEYALPDDSAAPTTGPEMLHLGSVALQLMFAGFGPMADWYYGLLFFLTQEPECHRLLREEIRGAFKTYEDITPSTTAHLLYLKACLDETNRILVTNTTGLPRYSPGAVVDGNYIPKGRWLPASHLLYEAEFADDACKGLPIFSLGPRGCSGRELAWTEARLFVCKVLWQFDVATASGQSLDMEGFEKTQLHYGFMVKPEVRLRFVPVEREA